MIKAKHKIINHFNIKMEESLVRLKCVKDKSKLRVRIISAGYNPYANCQFPRNIRVEGREYTVPANDITFSESNHHRFFYRVKKKNVKIVDPNDDIDISKIKVYGDEEDADCCICWDIKKDTIF